MQECDIPVTEKNFFAPKKIPRHSALQLAHYPWEFYI